MSRSEFRDLRCGVILLRISPYISAQRHTGANISSGTALRRFRFCSGSSGLTMFLGGAGWCYNATPKYSITAVRWGTITEPQKDDLGRGRLCYSLPTNWWWCLVLEQFSCTQFFRLRMKSNFKLGVFVLTYMKDFSAVTTLQVVW